MQRFGKQLNILFAVIASVFSIMLSAVSVSALVPDAARTGSASFSMTYEGQAVAGGELKLFRFADVALDADGESYTYVLIPALDDSGLDLKDMDSEDFAAALAAYIEEQELPAVTQRIDENGRARFSDLMVGLYVFYQSDAADGFEPIRPFTVAIPTLRDGELLYAIEASPKPRPLPTGSTEPTEPVEGEEKLPQTGQLKWPIPGLFLYGAFFVLMGIYLLDEEQEAQHDR